MSKVIKGSIPAPSTRPSQPPSSRPSPPVSVARVEKRPIMQREVVGANAEAKQIRGDAEARAGAILEEAREQAEQMRENGYREGYQEGLGQYTEQTTRALLEVEKLKAAIEPQYVALVRACVEKILGQEIKLNKDAVIGLVRNALRDAVQQREIIVRIHPDDAEHLRKQDHQRRLLDVLARATAIEIRDDPSVARGGCVVVTELGTIDASLDRQLTALERALTEEANAGPGPESFDDPEYAEEEES